MEQGEKGKNQVTEKYIYSGGQEKSCPSFYLHSPGILLRSAKNVRSFRRVMNAQNDYDNFFNRTRYTMPEGCWTRTGG